MSYEKQIMSKDKYRTSAERIAQSNERIARVRFEITSMISDQNCTTRSSIATLLDPFSNRTIFGEKQ